MTTSTGRLSLKSTVIAAIIAGTMLLPNVGLVARAASDSHGNATHNALIGSRASAGAETGITLGGPLALQLPESAFLPGIVDAGNNRSEVNADADADFGGLQHVASYDSLGRTAGWFQHATFGPLSLDYVGSTFVSSADARQAMRDGLEASALNGPPDNCGNIYSVPCYTSVKEFVPVASGGTNQFFVHAVAAPSTPTAPAPVPTVDPTIKYRDMYTVLQVNECLVEARVIARDDVFSFDRDAIVPALQSMVRAGFVQAQQVCPSPVQTPKLDFSIVQVRAENTTPGASYNLSHPGLQSVAKGTTVNLAVYFNMRSMFPNSRAIATFTVKRGYGVHFFFQSQPLKLTVCPNTYRITVPYTPRSVGTDVIVGRVSVDGVPDETTTTLRVVPTNTVIANPVPGVPARKGGAVHSNALANPAAFALPIAAFPPSSQVRVAQVASNALATRTSVPHLGAYNFTKEGRQTGFFADTVQSNSGHPVYTQYLVSVFANAAAADAAFSHQRTAYHKLAAAYPSRYIVAGPPIKVGDQAGYGYDLTRIGKRSFYTAELYFTRGRSYIEVVQSYFAADADPYGHRAARYLSGIAQQLDQLANS